MTDHVSLSLRQRANDILRNRAAKKPRSLNRSERAFKAELVLRLATASRSVLELSGKIDMMTAVSLAARLDALEAVIAELTGIAAQLRRVVRGDDSNAA